MNKEYYYSLINKYFKNKKVKDVFYKQIDLFFDVKHTNNRKYMKDDLVELNNYNLIHGTKAGIKDLNKIKETGLLSVEFYDKEYNNQKNPYSCEFWHIKENILLKDYINKYTGGTVIYETKEGKVEKIVPFNEIQNEINNSDIEYLRWEVYQTKEARFLPTNKNYPIAFILNLNNEYKELLDYSIQGNKLDEKVKKKILPKWFYGKYVKGRFHNYDSFETKREIAILFGLPSILIEGIIVNKTLEKDKKSLNKIKGIFPDCYICNIDGKVIVE